MCNHQQYLIEEDFHHSKQNFHAMKVNPHSTLSLIPGNHKSIH